MIVGIKPRRMQFGRKHPLSLSSARYEYYESWIICCAQCDARQILQTQRKMNDGCLESIRNALMDANR